ncbi:MAG: hypothetical protein KFB96_17425 [Thiocapsa sp.]|nr:hypothetical protein [Thiocapsa sp.]QVL47471.1 MAG: hypothetical protein KFB96_17425 [Thiocapsa sp.]
MNRSDCIDEVGMNQKTLDREHRDQARHSEITSAHDLEMLDPAMRASFSEPQIKAITTLLNAPKGRPAPKLVDLELQFNLLAHRFFVVLYVGRNRRTKPRDEALEAPARNGNIIAIILILIGFNLLISFSIILVAYLIKAAIGITLFPGPH